MALSTAIKNKMLEVSHLKYRLLVEIKNDDDSWIDFSDRDPKLPQIRLSTEKRKNQIVSSIASVSFTNDDNYFDYMDDPDASATTTKFGTLASKFAAGFRGKEVRISLRVFLPDTTWEDARLGVFRAKKNPYNSESNRVTFELCQDVDFLRSMGAESLSDGLKHHMNKPITYLVREILKRFYTSGVTASEFEIPDRVYLTTADGEPAFSHYGKPPGKDSSGRWRSDVTHNPTAIYYHADDGYFYFGIGDEVWQFKPDDEEWTLCGTFSDDDFHVRGIYRMASTRLLVVGWKYTQEGRSVTLKTGSVLTTTPVLTTNDPGYDSVIFPGEFVLRDVYHTGGSGASEAFMGYIKNAPDVGADLFYGVNMPVPFPTYAHSARANTAPDDNHLGIASGMIGEIASGDWDSFAYDETEPCGIITTEPCYLAMAGEINTSTEKTTVLIPWGMKPNLALASSPINWDGPVVFTVETDGNPLGIRNTGVVRIVAYNAYGGGHVTVSENDHSGALAPIYGLQYYNQGSSDYLYWIDVNWVEEMVNIGTGGSPGDVDLPIFNIKGGVITDEGSGDPELLDTNKFTLWTSGDNFFESTGYGDAAYAAITIFPYPLGSAIEGFLFQMMDTQDLGDECFRLYRTDGGLTGKTLLGTSNLGWGAFTPDYANDRIYFIERDSGRICYVDISSAPTTIYYLNDGDEPVPQSFFEMPQSEGFVIRTESSKSCMYGVLYPYLPGWTNDGLVWTKGKYYFWKNHFQLTDRVELFDETRQDAWDALGLLAEAVRYQVGLDPEGTGFFRPIPDGTDSEEFTIDLDSAICRHFKFKKLCGGDEIVNRSQFIPYDVTPGVPEATLDLIGYVSAGEQVYFDGETSVQAETLVEKNVTLHCIKGGAIGTATFKYLIHEYQIQTFLREDVSLGSPTQIRLDSNQDLEVGMLVQVGDWDEGAAIDTIQSDGDVILDTSLSTAYKQGTPVIIRSAEHGKWSTNYDTPDEYIIEDTFEEIGSTGLFLKFEENASGTTHNFVIADRIRIFNPGMKLGKSRTKKYMAEDSDSIEKYSASEYNPDNPYISLVLGRELSQGLVASDAEKHHGWEFECPLFLQVRPLMLIKVKSLKHLPVATDNEEKCYVKQVSHDVNKARTKFILRAVNSYG